MVVTTIEQTERERYNMLEITVSLDLIRNSTLSIPLKKFLIDYLENTGEDEMTLAGDVITKPLEEMDPEELRLLLVEFIISLNTSRLEEEHKERINNGSFTIQAVTSSPGLVYTIGLSLTKGFELTYIGGDNLEFVGEVIEELIQIIGESEPMEEYVLSNYVFENGDSLLVRLIPVQNTDIIIDELALGLGNPEWLPERPSRIYQILIEHGSPCLT